jgi:hypothetical protein
MLLLVVVVVPVAGLGEVGSGFPPSNNLWDFARLLPVRLSLSLSSLVCVQVISAFYPPVGFDLQQIPFSGNGLVSYFRSVLSARIWGGSILLAVSILLISVLGK